ncbi:MAG: hypothetical protein HYW24_05195 [Candidatus Aenigmarchaeota archaeon]|nr:hypothetical protein [Candidatus Aenigmarchaeota archaeon]
MKTAIAKETSAPVSFKHSKLLLKILKGKKVDRAKKLLENLLEEKRNLDGKHYTKTAKKLLGILESAEANAKNKTMDTEKLFIKNARVDKAEKLIRAKSRVNLRGRAAKRSNIEIIVEER